MQSSVNELKDVVRGLMSEILAASTPAAAPQPVAAPQSVAVSGGGGATTEVTVSPAGEVVVRVTPSATLDVDEPTIAPCYQRAAKAALEVMELPGCYNACYAPELPAIGNLEFSAEEEAFLAKILAATAVSRDQLLQRLLQRLIMREARAYAEDIGLTGPDDSEWSA